MATLILTHPDSRPDSDCVLLKELRDRCRDLDDACDLIARFASMLVDRRGTQDLEPWTLQTAAASRHPELRGFATGLRKDWDAVMAGLTLPWNSGPVEGHVNHIIMWLGGRCSAGPGPDLLRKRVLLSR